MNKSQALLIVVSVAVVATLVGASLYMGVLKNDDNLQVVASFYPLAYMAEEIGGDRVTVKSLIPANTEVHAWQPSPGDIMAADNADVLLYNGAGLDHWFEEKIIPALGQKNRTVAETTHGIDLIESEHDEAHILEEINHIIHEWEDGDMTAEQALEEIEELIHGLEHKSHLLEEIDHLIHEWEDGDMTAEEAMEAIEELLHGHDHGTRSTRQDDHDHGDVDPHTWVSPFIARQQAENIYKALVKADPEGESYYNTRWAAFSLTLSGLDARYKSELATKTNTTVVVAHAAYGYLAHRYGFEMHGAIGMSANQLPSASALAALVNLMEEEGVRTLYVNPIYSDAYIQTLKTEMESRTGNNVQILNLYLMLGPTDGLDYLEQMEHNLESLKFGLTG